MQIVKSSILTAVYVAGFLLLSAVLLGVAVVAHAYPRVFIGSVAIMAAVGYLRAREAWPEYIE